MNRGHYLDRDPLDKWFRKYHFPITQPPAAAGGSVATDVIFDAKGDLAVGTGADTASKLTVGADSKKLIADSGQTTGLLWVPDDLWAEYRRGSNTCIRETINPMLTRDGAVPVAATGVMHNTPVLLYKGDSIAGAAVRTGSAGINTPTHWWFALYDTSATPALVKQTADQTTTAWAANTTKDLAWSGGAYTVPSTGWYRFSMEFTATGMPTMVGQFNSQAAIMAGLVSGMLPFGQSSGSGLTTTAPGTIASPTNLDSFIHACLHS